MTRLLEELARTPPVEAEGVLHHLLRPGAALGRFELVREIGRGGCGVVFEARDRELGRLVAVKAIRPGGSAAELRKESLRREAELAAQLSHPNIVTLHDFGASGGLPYLILELLRGETLHDRLLRGPLAPGEVVAIARQVAEALAHAHAIGVVHRDLKPSNVFLTADGRVKVLDFGLAYIFGGRVPLRGGTPAYMAPEQRRDGPVDERADVYALGAILHEALTGEIPPAPDEPAAGAPRKAVPGPSQLRNLVAAMRSADPARRPRGAGELLPALEVLERRLARRGGRGLAGGRRALSPGRRVALAAASLAVLAAVVAGGVALRRGAHRTAPTTISSVAVLPFADLSPGRDQEYFSDGLAEEILNALAHVPGLRVAGRASSFTFKGKGADARRVGEALHVESVLEGSVRTSGRRVRVTAALVSAGDGFDLWSQSFEREVGDVFAVQDEIAGAVVKALHVAPPPRQDASARRRTFDPEAYRHHLLGRYYWNRLGDRENNRRAVSEDERALALDPSYAPAWAGLAAAVFAVGNDVATVAGEEEGCRRGLDAVDRAVQLDPGLAEAFSTRAQLRAWCRWDWAGARADVDRALALAPGDVTSQRRDGIMRLLAGDAARALPPLSRAAEADPLLPLTWRWIGVAEMLARRTGRAREALRRALELSPGDAYGTYLLAVTYLLDGDAAKALATVERAPDHGDADRFTALAVARHDLGDTQAPLAMARFHAWVGERDRAFEWLERSRRGHFMDLGFVKADPLLARLRGDPRYAELLGEMGFPRD